MGSIGIFGFSKHKARCRLSFVTYRGVLLVELDSHLNIRVILRAELLTHE